MIKKVLSLDGLGTIREPLCIAGRWGREARAAAAVEMELVSALLAVLLVAVVVVMVVVGRAVVRLAVMGCSAAIKVWDVKVLSAKKP